MHHCCWSSLPPCARLFGQVCTPTTNEIPVPTCDSMDSQLPHTTTGAPVRPYHLIVLYPPIGGCLFFLSCISVSPPQLVSHVGQPLNSISYSAHSGLTPNSCI